MTENDPLVLAYTRREAIADGVLIDATETAKEAGFRYPVALTAAAAPGLAQDAVVTKAAITRVVIAPPQSDLARIIKAGLQKAYYSADKTSRAYQQAQKLYFFYGARGFEPIWLSTGSDGKVIFSSNAASS